MQSPTYCRSPPPPPLEPLPLEEEGGCSLELAEMAGFLPLDLLGPAPSPPAAAPMQQPSPWLMRAAAGHVSVGPERTMATGAAEVTGLMQGGTGMMQAPEEEAAFLRSLGWTEAVGG